MLKERANPILLRGRVVQPDGTAPDRYVLLRGGRIASISRRRPPRSDDATYVGTRIEDWIFPGLLDLHTHASYNLLPLWDAPGAPYPNRFAWRGDERYRNDVRGMSRYLSQPDDEHAAGGGGRAHATLLATFSELQAVAGGTTTLQESHALDKDVRYGIWDWGNA